MNLSPNISKCWQPCKISSWVLGLQQSQKYSMDSGTDTQTKYSIYSDSSTAGAFLHFILKSNLLSPQCTPHRSHSNWGCPLRFWSTAILRALSVYWAVCVTIWTAFFWAVICITDQKKSPPRDFHTSAVRGTPTACARHVCKQNSMQKEIFAPTAMSLLLLNTCAYCHYVFFMYTH